VAGDVPGVEGAGVLAEEDGGGLGDEGEEEDGGGLGDEGEEEDGGGLGDEGEEEDGGGLGEEDDGDGDGDEDDGDGLGEEEDGDGNGEEDLEGDGDEDLDADAVGEVRGTTDPEGDGTVSAEATEDGVRNVAAEDPWMTDVPTWPADPPRVTVALAVGPGIVPKRPTSGPAVAAGDVAPVPACACGGATGEDPTPLRR
jgi:hypothetical protein